MQNTMVGGGAPLGKEKQIRSCGKKGKRGRKNGGKLHKNGERALKMHLFGKKKEGNNQVQNIYPWYLCKGVT